jgi:hypothetical protein
MRTHLSTDEFVDALDGALAAGRPAHLDACAARQAAVAALRATLHEAQQVPAPEPSPLFWEHFSDHVREATSNLTVPSIAWWHDWRPVGALATAVGALALVLLFGVGRPVDRPVETQAVLATAVPGDSQDDGPWALVVGLTDEAGLDFDDTREAVAPRSGTADAMIDELTPEQREALVRLLLQEMGDSE